MAQQRVRESMLARLSAPTAPAAPIIDGRGHRRLLAAVVVAAMLGGGVLAAQTFEFHPPASLVEAFLPRL